MSTPTWLRGELASSTSRGASLLLLPPAVALAQGGKLMAREEELAPVPAEEEDEAQVALESRGDEGGARQEPAVLRDTPELPQQAQAGQPGVSRALAEQQQLPRHRLVPQSKGLEQGSPGEPSRQEP
jgi:hypothetical protein